MPEILLKKSEIFNTLNFMKVPFVNLKSQYLSIKKDVDQAIHQVLDDISYVRGKYPTQFEENFAKAYGVRHCIGVGNGTDALYIALKMLSIGPGHEVITVANSWISSSETISQAGAKPVFVDIEPDYFNINPDLIEAKINERTKAVIAVHLYGQPASIEIIKTICQKHQLFLVEDCAQAHFAKFNGQYAGTFGDVAAFSFYPGKNLGAYGDAGGIITNNDELARKMRMFANHGALHKHDHLIEGINSRLDSIQAAVLNVKLAHIHKWNQKRGHNASLYNKLLKGLPQVQTPKIRDNATHIFHVYALRVERRDELVKYLNDNAIQTNIHYPTALPFLGAYKYLNHRFEDFPVAADYQHKIISLPMCPELTEEQIHYVADKIVKFYN